MAPPAKGLLSLEPFSDFGDEPSLPAGVAERAQLPNLGDIRWFFEMPKMRDHRSRRLRCKHALAPVIKQGFTIREAVNLQSLRALLSAFQRIRIGQHGFPIRWMFTIYTYARKISQSHFPVKGVPRSAGITCCPFWSADRAVAIYS
jgi:hypothetical protein